MHWIKKTAIALIILAGIVCVAAMFVLRMPVFGAELSGERLARAKRSLQFEDDHFTNHPPQSDNHELLKTLRYYMQGQVREPQFQVPVISIPRTSLTQPPASGLATRWIGHASVLVEIDGVRLMTDPVLSDRVSPVPIGPTRLHASPMRMEDVQGINAVLISHDHYDHLDMPTIMALAAKKTLFFVPLGIGAHLERWGVSPEQIREMDWWESAQLKGISIYCTPARHYSGRKGMDNSTLWSSWYVKSKNNSFYFSGDTGYAEHFREIRNRLGPVQMTLMKIGAYGEPESWNDIHMDPESAVKAHLELGGDVLLPIHWATFNLAYHAWDEPILRTLKAAEGRPLTVITPLPGELFVYGSPFVNKAWYVNHKGQSGE